MHTNYIWEAASSLPAVALSFVSWMDENSINNQHTNYHCVLTVISEFCSHFKQHLTTGYSREIERVRKLIETKWTKLPQQDLLARKHPTMCMFHFLYFTRADQKSCHAERKVPVKTRVSLKWQVCEEEGRTKPRQWGIFKVCLKKAINNKNTVLFPGLSLSRWAALAFFKLFSHYCS